MVVAFALVLALSQGSAPRQAGSGSAGEIPRFEKPAWTSPDPFTYVASIRELSDGRVLVADLGETAVRLLSARGVTLQTIGRVGSGPGEYRVPLRLLAYRGDTTLLIDRTLLRWLVIDPTGKTPRTIPFPKHVGHPLTTALGFLPDGRVVYQATIMRLPSDDPMSAIAAIKLSGEQRDSLEAVRLPGVIRQKRGEGSDVVLITRGVRFSPEDDWVMAPDGAIGIARVDPFHIEWLLASGKVVRGPEHRADLVPVTDSEKLAARELPLPSTKPPFIAGQSLADPFGRLWVKHYSPSGSETARWSVFDRSGACVARVELPKRSSIEHLSRLGVYVVRRDDDDLQWLELYSWGTSGKASRPARSC